MQKGVDIDFDSGYFLFVSLHFHEGIKLKYISINLKDVYTHIILWVLQAFSYFPLSLIS